MKELRFLLLGLVICLASGVKAQFYDSADDIYYYVYYDNGELKPYESVTGGACNIFNFDGKKACRLGSMSKSLVVDYLNKNPNHFEDAVETTEYSLKFVSSTPYETVYQTYSGDYTFKFSKDRNSLTIVWDKWYMGIHFHQEIKHKKVDKSFFKVGRSKTPSGTMHE